MSDFAGGVGPEPGGPFLPSGVLLGVPDFADVDSVSRVPDCVDFGEPRSGVVVAKSDFAGDIDPGPGEPLLPSGVHLDMPGFADIDNVSQVPDCGSFGEPGSGTMSPESGSVMAMSDFVGDIDPGADEPLLGSAVIFDRPSFVSDCEQMQTWDFVYSINPEHGRTSPESCGRLAVPDVVGDLLGDRGQIPDNSDSGGCHSEM